MKLFRNTLNIESIVRGLILSGALAAGAAAVYTVAAMIRQPPQATAQTTTQEPASEFERTAQALQLDLTDEQKSRISLIEQESAKRRFVLTEQLQTLEQTVNSLGAAGTIDDAAKGSGLSRARAALKFDLDSIPAQTRHEIRRILNIAQRAKLDRD